MKRNQIGPGALMNLTVISIRKQTSAMQINDSACCYAREVGQRIDQNPGKAASRKKETDDQTRNTPTFESTESPDVLFPERCSPLHHRAEKNRKRKEKQW